MRAKSIYGGGYYNRLQLKASINGDLIETVVFPASINQIEKQKKKKNP